MEKIVIIGGGVSGVLSAIGNARRLRKANIEYQIIILEQNNMLLKKMHITGKGRCNITNAQDISKHFEYITRNPKFLYSAYLQFTNNDIINMIEENGTKTCIERGKRVFPESSKSISVIEALKKELFSYPNIQVRYNSEVVGFNTDDENIIKEVIYNRKNIKTKELVKEKIQDVSKVILATGGKSYKATGATGTGYILAKQLGHTIVDTYPALVPFNIHSLEKFELVQGLTLKNVSVKLVVDMGKNKCEIEEFGELLFTHFGVSGPTILRLSSLIYEEKSIQKKCKKENINIFEYLEKLMKDKKVYLSIDLKPALNYNILEEKILKEIILNSKKKIVSVLEKMLPKNFVNVFLNNLTLNNNNLNSNIKRNIKSNDYNYLKNINCSELKKEDRKIIIDTLKEFKIYISSFRSFNEAIITKGGVKIKEVNPKNMQSTKCKNLYIVGEVLDVDALTGGYNLQIAYSTGYIANIF